MSDVGVNLVDFHCHLDLHPDMQAAFDLCERNKCTALAVTTTPKAFPRNQEFATRTTCVHAALGLHPQLVHKRGNEIALFERLAKEARFIGEVGLDAGPRHYGSFKKQIEVFERALAACVLHGDKVISVHSVRCPGKVLDSLELLNVTHSCKVVLHWFSAATADIRRAIALGCWFSVNERMLATTAGKNLVNLVPLNRLLTETDAPFMKIDGVAIQVGNVGGAISLISRNRNFSEYEMAAIIAENADQLLKL